MAQPTYLWEVITPFANNGSKDTIPNTTEDGSVSMESGYGTLYETPPSEGGRFVKRSEWNYLINFLFNAVKELQQVITAGEFTVSASQTLTSILPIALGGTGANTAEQARSNLGLGNVDNTSDINKPISNAMQNALNMKQDVGDYATNQALQNGLNSKLNITGGTMTGDLVIKGKTTNVLFNVADSGTFSQYFRRNADNSSLGYIQNYERSSLTSVTLMTAVSPTGIRSQFEVRANDNGTVDVYFNCDSCSGTTAFFQSLASKIKAYL